MGKVFFTRHGQTIWNVENKICGATDIELTELGHQQAEELGRKLRAEQEERRSAWSWRRNSRGSMRYYIHRLFVQQRLPDIYRK